MAKVDWQVTTATVTQSVYSGRSPRGRHEYAVSFEYFVDGVSYRGEAIMQGIREANATFELRYDRDRPQENEWSLMPEPPKPVSYKKIGFIVTGIAVLVLVGLLIWQYLQEP